MIDRKRFSWIPCAWLIATPALAEEPDATLRAIETSVAAEAMQSAIDAADAALQARIDAEPFGG